MPEKSIRGTWSRVILSKSCQVVMYVVSAMHTALNANPMSSVAGSASTAHHEWVRPMSAMTTRNIAEYADPRSWPHVISPRAMSAVESGVS